jgi:hypothetical protein
VDTPNGDHAANEPSSANEYPSADQTASTTDQSTGADQHTGTGKTDRASSLSAAGRAYQSTPCDPGPGRAYVWASGANALPVEDQCFEASFYQSAEAVRAEN